MTTTRRRRFLAALSALVVCALPAVVLVQATPSPACQYVDAEVTALGELALLQADGWHGDPSDGVERLYSPACQ